MKLRKKCIEDVLELVGLKEFKKYFPKQLSGGLLRRLNIACGIAHKPELIFFDEPTVAVDPQSRNNILEGIKALNKKGATIIYTTHYMEEAENLCNRIVVLDKGKIIASGTKEELIDLIDVEEKVTIEVEKMTKKSIEEIKNMKNVTNVDAQDNIIHIFYQKGSNNIARLIDYLRENNIKYNKIFSSLPTLNDVFLALTGKELRD